MRSRWLFLILFFSLQLGLALGQAGLVQGGGAAAVNQPAPLVPSSVAPDAPVITIEGLCDNGFLTGLMVDSTKPEGAANRTGAMAKPGQQGPSSSAFAQSEKDCKTVITRAQWEKFSDAVQPPGGPQAVVPAPANSRLVKRYSELLLYARKAREIGLDKEPAVQEEVRFATLQVLSGALTRHFRAQADKISDAEVEKIYKEHPEKFEVVELERIYIPKFKQQAPDPILKAAKPDPDAEEAEMKAVAEKIHKEAVAGGDFQKLEDEAYQAAGVQESPSVDLGTVTRAQIPPEYKNAIFDLKEGQISEVEPATNGWHIFRISKKQTLPPERARGIVVAERMSDIVDPFRTSIKADLNPEYFQKSDAH
jgi:parvulin-like peptidyl-prolyl isomerase